MSVKKVKVSPKLFETYLSVIANSPKAKMFRNFSAVVNGRKTDITHNGELSCAFFVSFILSFFKQINSGHTTVNSTIKDLIKNGWRKINKPLPGAVLVWEENDFGKHGMHKHIGFYIGDDKAVSNSEKRRFPIKHHWTYKGKRKVDLILFNKKFSAQ